MKKLILLSLLLSATLSAVALDYKYEPLAQEGARWTCSTPWTRIIPTGLPHMACRPATRHIIN